MEINWTRDATIIEANAISIIIMFIWDCCFKNVIFESGYEMMMGTSREKINPYNCVAILCSYDQGETHLLVQYAMLSAIKLRLKSFFFVNFGLTYIRDEFVLIKILLHEKND